MPYHPLLAVIWNQGESKLEPLLRCVCVLVYVGGGDLEMFGGN